MTSLILQVVLENTGTTAVKRKMREPLKDKNHFKPFSTHTHTLSALGNLETSQLHN